MYNRYKKLLEFMLADLITCWQKKQPEKILLESALLIAQKHCNNCRSHVWQHRFESNNEEVNFYRIIQPQIAGHVMYYAILYESFLSCPQGEEDATEFWQKEMQRYGRFAAKNKKFVDYITSGNTALDSQYFLVKNHASATSGEQLSFACCELQTEWSVVAIKYFAELNYRAYAEGKVQLAFSI